MSIAARLDRLPLGRFHWKLTMVTGIAWLLNSFNVSMLSFALPVIIVQWNLTSAQAGLIGSVQMIGMLLGSIVIGNLSDRFGRKVTFEISLVIIGLATALGAFSDNYLAFTALRLIAGIGLGGMLPIATTLISELSPSRRRGALVVVLDSFWSFGFFIAAAVSTLMIPTFGWQLAFSLGALPVLYAVVTRLAMPESPRFLVERGRHHEAEDMLRKIESGYAVELPPLLNNDKTPARVVSGARFRELWSDKFRKRTISIWIVNFGLVFTNFGIFTWLPTLLVAAGYSLTEAFQFMIAVSLVQVPGKALSAFLTERVGRKWTIVPSFLVYALAAFFLGRATGTSDIILWGCTLSFVNAVVYGTVLAYTAESYPTRARSTGAGAATAFSRVGGILGPAYVGFLLGIFQGDRAVIFAGFAIALTISAFTVALLSEETSGRSLEDIAT